MVSASQRQKCVKDRRRVKTEHLSSTNLEQGAGLAHVVPLLKVFSAGCVSLYQVTTAHRHTAVMVDLNEHIQWKTCIKINKKALLLCIINFFLLFYFRVLSF